MATHSLRLVVGRRPDRHDQRIADTSPARGIVLSLLIAILLEGAGIWIWVAR